MVFEQVNQALISAPLLLSFATLIKSLKQAPTNPEGIGTAIINFWLVFMLIWLFLYANLSVGKEWPVMWFFVGFAVSVFVFDKNRRYLIRKPGKFIEHG